MDDVGRSPEYSGRLAKRRGHKRNVLSECHVQQLAKWVTDDSTVPLNFLHMRQQARYNKKRMMKNYPKTALLHEIMNCTQNAEKIIKEQEFFSIISKSMREYFIRIDESNFHVYWGKRKARLA